MFSREAFKLCITAFPEVLLAPKNLEARGRMLLGAAMAGLAIENSMLGAAHAAANAAILVSFDQAFKSYGIECRILT